MSSLRLGYSGCTRTLRFNMSHTCLLGFKSILCAGHCSVRRGFVTSITCVLRAAWRGLLSFANIILRLKRIWGKRTGRMTSFGCHIAFMFPWMCIKNFIVHLSACARSFMLIFTILLFFHIRQSTNNTFLPKTTTTLSCTRRTST